MKLPKWARKPKHKNKVVASSKGWILEETGELLVSIKNLDVKLANFLREPEPEKQEPTKKEEKKPTPPKKKAVKKKSPPKKKVAKKRKTPSKNKTTTTKKDETQ